MKFVIDRKKWLRGDKGDSYLLRSTDEKQCCLGFYLEACGVPRGILTDRSDPFNFYYPQNPESEETYEMPHEARWLLCPRKNIGGYNNSLGACELMNYNDSTCLEEERREVEISRIFKENGVEVEFIN